MKFNDIPYQRPNMEEVKKYFKDLTKNLEVANSGAEQIKLIEEFANFKKDLNTTRELANARHSIDTSDKFYEAEMDFFDENDPIIATLNTEVSRAIILNLELS